MKFWRIIIVFSNILFVISLYCCVPDEVILHGDISGYVTNSKTSEPLDSALIELNQSNRTIDTTLSGNDGFYNLRNLKPGSYEIQASKSTFEIETKNVTVEPTKTSNINFEIGMQPHPLISDSYLDFGLDSVTRTFTISNVGAGTLRYSLITSQDWIVIESNEGEVTTETDTIQVAVNRTGLSGEKAEGEIRFSYYVSDGLKESIIEVLVNGVMDIDGNYYGAVTIGTQTWLSENLNTGKIVTFWDPAAGSPYHDDGVIERYCMRNDSENCNEYGGGYSWTEMMDYPEEDDTTGMIQGICPAGWHIPSLDEWSSLINYVGGISVAGGMLKATGTIEDGTGKWYAPNTGATNQYGFTALPGGSPLRSQEQYPNLGIGAFIEFGTATSEMGSTSTVLLWFDHGRVVIGNIQVDEPWPVYVRCIRDP